MKRISDFYPFIKDFYFITKDGEVLNKMKKYYDIKMSKKIGKDNREKVVLKTLSGGDKIIYIDELMALAFPSSC